jgi:hypothetical protein
MTKPIVAWLAVALGFVAACSELPLKQKASTAAGGTGGDVGGAPVLAGAVNQVGGSLAAGTSSGGAGQGGAVGSSGIGQAGAPEQAGAAGSAADACPHGAGDGFQVGLHREVVQDPTTEIHPFLRLSHTGPYVVLNRLKLRYYLSAEAPLQPSYTCFYVTGVPCMQLRETLKPVAEALPEASDYIEFSFTSDDTVVLAQDPLEIRTSFTSAGQKLTQANDYSFAPASGTILSTPDFDYEETERVTLYLDDELVWGTEPCAR